MVTLKTNAGISEVNASMHIKSMMKNVVPIFALGYDVFSSNLASASDISNLLEQILQKLNVLSSTSSQSTATMTHIGKFSFVATLLLGYRLRS